MSSLQLFKHCLQAMIIHVLCLLCIFNNLLCIMVLEKHGKHKVTRW